MPGPFPKPPACAGCSFEHVGRGFVAPDPLHPTGLLVYGEAPGEEEEREGKGFVGRSGRLLRGALQRAGIPLSSVSFTNAILCRPPWNEYPDFFTARECARHHPRPEANGFSGPLIAYGQNAAEFLSGFKFAPLTVRGTLLPVEGSNRWFVYSIHPAFILRAQSKGRGAEVGKAMEELYPLLALDASRAKDSLTPRIPRIELPTVDQLRIAFVQDRPTVVSIDIEGKDGIPQIVGFSWRLQHAFVLPWSEPLRIFLDEIFQAGQVLPLFHNAAYDVPELRQAGVRPPRRWIDTINLAALVDPSLKLGLQPQVLSWVPGTVTWKGLINHKEGPDYAEGDVETYRRLWTEVITRLGRRVPSNGTEWYYFYNGLDTAWTFELFHQHRRELTSDGDRFDSYYMRVMFPLQTLLMEITERGLPFDPGRAEYHTTACLRLERMAKGIADLVGREILVRRHSEAEDAVAILAAERENELAQSGLRKFSGAAELTKARGKLRAAKEALDEGFNIRSNKQRTGLIYDWFGLPVQKNNDGNPTADEDALLSLHRRLNRLDENGDLDPTIKPTRGTRVEVSRLLKALIAGGKWAHWRTNYLRPPTTDRDGHPWLITQYTQHRADTGRLTSGIDISDPEKAKERVQQVQNIPKKLRDVVRAEPGRLFIAADWAAIQWALAMWFCAKVNRPVGYHMALLERFQRGEMDPHRFLAAQAYAVEESAVKNWQRTNCKPYTFGYLFDGSPYGLADNAGHERKVGKRVCAAHDRAFITQPWKDYTVQEARGRKFVETPLGWRRWFWGLDPKSTEILATLIQATEADLLKYVLVSIAAEKPFDFRLMTTTHDSIMIDCNIEDKERGAAFLKAKMEQPIPWLDGRSWRAAVKIGETWRDVS